MSGTRIKFGTYLYEDKGKDWDTGKYWKCVPVADASSSEKPYEIRWWRKANPASAKKNQILVSRKEALRRIEAKLRGGYTLVEEHADDKVSSLLEWFDN